jgi:hypothetical protein
LRFILLKKIKTVKFNDWIALMNAHRKYLAEANAPGMKKSRSGILSQNSRRKMRRYEV